jgi:hypothetical protein
MYAKPHEDEYQSGVGKPIPGRPAPGCMRAAKSEETVTLSLSAIPVSKRAESPREKRSVCVRSGETTKYTYQLQPVPRSQIRTRTTRRTLPSGDGFHYKQQA